MSIRDPTIATIAEKTRSQKINRLFLPLFFCTITNLITNLYIYFQSNGNRSICNLYLSAMDTITVLSWLCVLKSKFKERWFVTTFVWVYFTYQAVLVNLIERD